MASGLTLNRVDVHQVGATARRTMRLLPVGKKGMQKMAVGDENGELLVFNNRQGMEESASCKLDTRVARLSLGGATGDQIFMAAGSKVYAVTKKCKQFFTLDINTTEAVTSLCVDRDCIWVVTSNTVTSFVNGALQGQFACPDRINDMTLQIEDDAVFVVLACQDGVVRLLNGAELRPASETTVEGPVTTVFAKKGVVLYGLVAGGVGQLPTTRGRARKGWYTEGKARAAVTCLELRDLAGWGEEQLFVARENGVFEVFEIKADFADPTCVFSISLNESITSLDIGLFSNLEQMEVVLATFSGKIIAFTPTAQNVMERPEQTLRGIISGSTGQSSTKEQRRIQELNAEIEQLQKDLNKEREKYSKHSAGLIPVTSSLQVRATFTLSSSEALYVLALESGTPIDMIVLRSDVPVDLIDVTVLDVVVSRSPVDPANANFLLATLRFQAPTLRVEIKVRSIEGQQGTLQSYLLPRGEPRTSRLTTHEIRPLSLHERVANVETDGRPLNELRLKGNFSLGDVHAWVSLCLPDVSDRSTADSFTYNFRSTFLGTILICECRRGDAVFRSDSVSTISILKEVISREATARKLALDLDFNIRDETVVHVLSLLHSKLEYQLSLTQKMHIIEALKELQMQPEDQEAMPTEYREILDNATRITQENKQQANRLEFIFGIITDLYIDKFKFKGMDVKSRVDQLVRILDKYTFDALVAFFNTS